MIYLTASHQPPPHEVILDGRVIPTFAMIARGDTAGLAPLGIFPHIPTTDPKPLGSEWILTGGQYVEVPIGTAQEIADALAAEALALQRALWAQQAQARRVRAARKVLAEPLPFPFDEPMLDRKIEAVQILQGA